MTDHPDIEAEAIATAAAALGDRHAAAPITIGKSEATCLGTIADRRFMTSPDAIVEWMARDILGARRAGDQGHLVDLTEFGWSTAQAMRWGSQAHAAALDPRIATHDTVVRLMVREERHGVSARTFERITDEAQAAVAAALATPATGDLGGDAA